MRVTSDILSVGALWGSSGDVYNGLFFFWAVVFWIVYFLAKCDRKLGSFFFFRNSNLLIYL